MFTNKVTLGLRFILTILAAFSLLPPLPSNAVSLAQSDGGTIEEVRSLDTNDLGLLNPAGLAFSPEANVFFVLEAHTKNQANIVTITPYEEFVASVSVDGSLIDPINMAFDDRADRLLLLDTVANQLIEIKAGPDGSLEPSPAAVTRFGVGQLGLQDPRGMTMDAANGELLILDSGALQIVRIQPDSQGGFDGATALSQGRISRVDLKQAGLVDPRGLAFNPSNGHLYLLDPGQQALYELAQTGQVVETLDLSPFELVDPQGLAFAPSADLTDDPSTIHLYVADTGLSAGLGRIIEFSLAPLVSTLFVTAADVPVDYATLVRTTQTSLFSPPSPDPSGIAYRSDSGTLLISDGEVEEMPPYWAGTNLWETTLAGSVVRTQTTTSFSSEPTGVAHNPFNSHLFFSDDNAFRVFEKNPGTDGLLWTSDDILTSFKTTDFGDNDPEGITYDTWNGHLFIADGANAEVYEVAPGANGRFDGVPPSGDDLVTHFDTAGLLLTDPESVEFNPNNGHLYVLSGNAKKIGETTTDGALIRYVDFSAAQLGTTVVAAAGLAYAPASNNSGQWNLYIVARGVDNSQNSQENDGMLYEISFDAVNRQNQTITIVTSAPGSAIYGTSFTVAATASSGLPVAITTTGACTGNGSGSASVTMTSGTGTCTVHYNQAGNANYNAAPEMTQNVTAQKVNQTITVTTHAPPNAGYNTTFTVAATASSGLAVAITTTDACMGSGSGSASVTMTSSTGTCTVHYNQAGNADYNAAPEMTESANAQKASQSITVTTHAPASAANGTSFTVAATGGGSGNPATYRASGVCSNVGATFTITSSTGTCMVHYNQGGDANYNPAPEVTETVSAQRGGIYLPFVRG